MYTFLIGEDNTLNASVTERIMERSKLVDKIHFLADATYKDTDMTDFTVTLEYQLPISKRYKTEILQRSDELYKGKLEYILPVDTNLTSEPGDIELWITFANVDMDEDGNVIQMVRKVGPGEIRITPISNWSDMIPDEALSAVDQRILAVTAQLKALSDRNNAIIDGKADSLSYKNNILQLTANGKPIGSSVKITDGSGGGNEDGTIRVVEF